MAFARWLALLPFLGITALALNVAATAGVSVVTRHRAAYA